jgi:hypothetical protein
LGRVYQNGPQPVVVPAGATVHVELGGAGHTVVGRASFTSGSEQPAWRFSPVGLRLKTGAQEKYQSNDRAFWTSPEGRDITRAQRSYWTFCSEDGSFRFNDIPEGAYELTVELHQSPESSTAPASSTIEPPAIATATKPIEVRNSDLDAGLIELKPRNAKQL